MNPYIDYNRDETSWTREFCPDVDNDELVWHRDKKDRTVEILEGDGWFFQMDEDVPFEMKAGDVLNIPMETYHRIYKSGCTPLKIRITER